MAVSAQTRTPARLWVLLAALLLALAPPTLANTVFSIEERARGGDEAENWVLDARTEADDKYAAPEDEDTSTGVYLCWGRHARSISFGGVTREEYLAACSFDPLCCVFTLRAGGFAVPPGSPCLPHWKMCAPAQAGPDAPVPASPAQHWKWRL